MLDQLLKCLFGRIGIYAHGIGYVLRTHGIAAPIGGDGHLNASYFDPLFCRLTKSVIAVTATDR